MTSEDLLDELDKRPFKPLRIFVSDGSSYEVQHPELCAFRTTSLVVAFSELSGEMIVERTMKLDCNHICRLELLTQNRSVYFDDSEE